MKKLFCSLAAALLITFSPAKSSTFSSEITDMWYVVAESGWGVNIIVQHNIAFGTFFLYDTNQNPVWYTAQLTQQPGTFFWSGPLYATRGPWYGGPYPSLTSIRQAGTATFNLINLNQATLTYTVDGVAVTKTLVRQFWTYENLTGTIAGGYSIRTTACTPSSLNGIQEEVGVLSINHTGNTSIVINAAFQGLACNFAGTYSQYGKLGQVNGNYSCTDGVVGSFIASEITPTVSGFTARVSGQNQYCQWSGYFGGIRRAQ